MSDEVELLYDRKVRGLHVSFGHGSEIGVFKEPGFLSVGLSLCGEEANKADDVLYLFTARGAKLLASADPIVIDQTLRRVFLLKVHKKSQLLAAFKELQTCGEVRSTWRVGPTEPIIVWSPV